MLSTLKKFSNLFESFKNRGEIDHYFTEKGGRKHKCRQISMMYFMFNQICTYVCEINNYIILRNKLSKFCHALKCEALQWNQA